MTIINSLNLLNLFDINDKRFQYNILSYKNERFACADDYRLTQLTFALVDSLQAHTTIKHNQIDRVQANSFERPI